ncbi:MAG: glycosyltransferase family 9 protein [Flavobacteriaceae bacterium]|nr:glycosyltransferase family 9 protein [Flavobacteriaceae bacterium]
MKLRKHILIIRLSSMGDVAMVSPVLKELLENNKNYKISLLTNFQFFPFFRAFNGVNLIPFDKKKQHKGLLGMFRLFKEIKKLDLDYVVDLHEVLRTNFLKAVLKVPFYQIDKGRDEKQNLVSGKIFAPLKSTHQRYRDVFEKIGISIKPLSKTQIHRVDISDLKLIPKNNKLLIGIAPFAAHNGKEYPIVQMEEVIKEINKDFNVILFGGGKKEEFILDDLAGKHSNVINIANKFSLDQEMDVISNLSIMLSMDSANGHIAALMGIKVLTIWGVTHPFAGFSPYGQTDKNNILVNRLQFPKIPTSIYGEKFPNGYEKAISSISPKEIISKLRTLV